jgi:D-alanyl-D-alanine carboxypeptidase
MTLTSKTIMHTFAGGSICCALTLVALYGTQAPLHRATTAEAHQNILYLDIDPDVLEAHAAVVYDPSTKEFLFTKNSDERLPLASLTKLMSADAVLHGAKLDEPVTITANDLKPEGDWGFKVGEEWHVSQLLKFGLVASSNDAMAAAASALGGNVVDYMNARAKQLGLTQTYFYNPTGLDLDLETAGAYGSAHDVALLAAAFLTQFPEEFEATAVPNVSISSASHRLEATSTAAPLLEIPGLIGAKTGYTDLAGGNLVAAFDIEVGRPLVIAVLGSSREGRFKDVKTIISKARELFNAQH